MKTNTITIIDHGRGPQLSTSRITVQDLVPYFQQNYTHSQIREIMPCLSDAEIEVVERYVRDNYEAVMERDRHIRERAAKRQNPPAVTEALQRGGEKMAILREEFKKRKKPLPEANGDCTCGRCQYCGSRSPARAALAARRLARILGTS
jgi:hypothetical protein